MFNSQMVSTAKELVSQVTEANPTVRLPAPWDEMAIAVSLKKDGVFGPMGPMMTFLGENSVTYYVGSLPA